MLISSLNNMIFLHVQKHDSAAPFSAEVKSP